VHVLGMYREGYPTRRHIQGGIHPGIPTMVYTQHSLPGYPPWYTPSIASLVYTPRYTPSIASLVYTPVHTQHSLPCTHGYTAYTPLYTRVYGIYTTVIHHLGIPGGVRVPTNRGIPGGVREEEKPLRKDEGFP